MSNLITALENRTKKDQFAAIRPSRHLTLSYEAKQEICDVIRLIGGGINWKLIKNTT
ncbi:35398_t:CDS:1, partial [Racocetra persica]